MLRTAAVTGPSPPVSSRGWCRAAQIPPVPATGRRAGPVITARQDVMTWPCGRMQRLGSSALRMAPRPAGKASHVVIALGSNVHIFVRPHRRRELAQRFETVLGSPVRTVEFPGIDQPMLVVR